VNVSVSCGGVVVSPGDIVVGDVDGIVVVPRRSAPAVIDGARSLQRRLEAVQPQLAEGRITGIDEIQDDLRKRGLVEIDDSYEEVL
jgi:regulator of RNase E activity RraA